jgi:hypothetical protein
MTFADVAIGPEVSSDGNVLGFVALGAGIVVIVIVSILILRGMKKKNDIHK